jgi:hypothetical protein
VKVLLCFALVLALASCGVGAQGNPNLFESDEVPFGLMDTAPVSSTAPTGSNPSLTTTSHSVAYDIYLIRAGVLVAVIRRTTSAPTPADVLAALLEGPTPAEVTAGLRTALTGPDIISRTRSTATIVTVDLARTFNEIPRSDRILALGQITLTLTGQPEVTLIQYTIDNAPIEVPKANGVVTRDPVARADYVSLLQPPTTTSTGPSQTTRSIAPTATPTSG